MSFKSKMKILGRKTWKHAPTIATTLGIATGIAATVIACKKTPEFIIAKDCAVDDYKRIDHCLEKGTSYDENGTVIDYTEKSAQYDRIIVSKNLVCDFIKTYWLPLTLETTSIALISFSHVEMSKRNTALGAAATSIANAFALYRQNNIAYDENGEERDKNCLYGIRNETITDNAYDDDGNIVASEEVTKPVINLGYNNTFTFIFGPDNKYWRPDPLLNEDFLKLAQSQLNQMLKANGFLTVLDVVKYLDLPLSKPDLSYKEMSIMGWVYGYHAGKNSDGYVNFRVTELNNLLVRNLDDIMDNGYLINLNVDGVIDDIIDRIERSKG